MMHMGDDFSRMVIPNKEIQIKRYTDSFGSSDYIVCAYIGKKCVENYGNCSSYSEAKTLQAKVTFEESFV